jgi:hypothetical protein
MRGLIGLSHAVVVLASFGVAACGQTTVVYEEPETVVEDSSQQVAAVLGRWTTSDSTSAMEFHSDARVVANPGRGDEATGQWRQLADGSAEIEVFGWRATARLVGDTLQLTPSDGGATVTMVRADAVQNP